MQAAARPDRIQATFRAITNGQVVLCLSRALVAEITDVLARPAVRTRFPTLTDRAVAAFLADMRSYEEFWKTAMRDNDICILPIELRHTSKLTSLPWHHKDPFDRLLAAQALVEQIPLISADSTFDAYGVERIH